MAYNHRQIFQRLDTILSSNPRCPLRVLAGLLDVHCRTIQRTVHESAGMTFQKYRNKKLLEQSLSLLEEEGLSEKEIACRVGFDCTSSFSRFVKRATGQTPTSLR
jgi:AraC-like DNA-binding protein